MNTNNPAGASLIPAFVSLAAIGVPLVRGAVVFASIVFNGDPRKRVVQCPGFLNIHRPDRGGGSRYR